MPGKADDDDVNDGDEPFFVAVCWVRGEFFNIYAIKVAAKIAL